MARMQPPEWPAFPPAEALRRALSGGAVVGDRGGAVERPGDRADARDVRHQRQLPAVARRPPGGRRRHHRRPRAGRRADAGRGARPGGARRHGLGRRGRRRQAYARATAGRWSTATRNCRSSPPAPRSWRSTSSRSSGCAAAPMGMTAHVVYTAWDAERPASLSPTVIARHHPRPHRLRRLADERRSRHGGAVGRLRRARRGRGRGGLRRRAALLGQDGRDDRGRRARFRR